MKTCKHCHSNQPDEAAYCAQCGKWLGTVAGQGLTVPMGSQTQKDLGLFDEQSIIDRVVQSFGDGHAGLGNGGFPHQAFDGPGDSGGRRREVTILVNDVSGSMAGQYTAGKTKLDASIQASIAYVLNKEHIDPDDRAGIVSFNSKAHVWMQPQPVRTHRDAMIDHLHALKIDGGTDLDQGLKAAEALLDGEDDDVVKRVVMLTDGMGGDPRKRAQRMKDAGCIIDVTGIGPNEQEVNAKLLREIASVIQGQSRYRFVTDGHTLQQGYTALAGKTALA